MWLKALQTVCRKLNCFHKHLSCVETLEYLRAKLLTDKIETHQVVIKAAINYNREMVQPLKRDPIIQRYLSEVTLSVNSQSSLNNLILLLL